MQRGDQQQQAGRRIDQATDIEGVAPRQVERIAKIEADRAGGIEGWRVAGDIGKVGEGGAGPLRIRVVAPFQHGAIEAAQRGRNVGREIDGVKVHGCARQGRADQIAALFGQDAAFRQQ